MDLRKRPIWQWMWLAVNAGVLIFAAPLASAQISLVNTAFYNNTADGTSYTTSFNAGASSNKLIVAAATESNPPITGITYHGAALTLIPGTGASGRFRGIWYLDAPHTGGAANIVVSGDGTNFGHMRLGIASISEAAPGYAAGNAVIPGTSVAINVPVANSFVLAGFGANQQATPAAAAPLTQIGATDGDSSAACFGYQNSVTSGPETYSFTGNTTNPETAAAVFIPASAAPVIIATSPADDETNVAAGTNLVATFSEPVVAGTGGTITLKRTSDDSTVENFDVTTSTRLTFDGQTLTIDPTGDLGAGIGYHVRIAQGAIMATSDGDAFGGIADSTSWNFTGDSPPVITTLVPADNAANISLSANLVANFNETVMAGTGNITLKRTSDDSTVESFDVSSSPRLSFSGSELTIDLASDLETGVGYHVLVDPTAITDVAANHFAGISDSTTWSFTTRPGLDTVDGRLVSMIQANIDDPWPGITDPDNAAGIFSNALATLYLDTNVGQANDLLATYYSRNPVPDSDTSDYGGYFWQHILWRLYHDPAMNARLTPAVRSTLEANMWRWLRTRSTLAEAQGSEWVIHDSENHDAMQKGSHLMCLVALKDAPGYGPDRVLADGGTIAEHLEAWTEYFLRYFRVRAQEGINVEIASPIYAKYSVGAYYNIMDFADSPALRSLARKFIDLYWADTASDWTSSGVRGGAETRCYKDNYLRLGSSYSFHSLMWGYGWHTRSNVVRTYPMIPAVSSYRIPESITACAADTNRPNFLYSSRRFGRGGGWDGDRNYRVVFDSGNSNLRRDTFVTPDYSMGTFTVDINKDYIALIDQNRAMGVMFASGVNDRVMVFGKGGSDPRTTFADISGVTRENCMVVQRDPNASSHGNATLVFLSTAAWNNRVESGGWFFTRLGNAYCAIKPAGGGYTSTAASQGYELTLGDLWAPVVIQMGQAADYPSFADFQTSVTANGFTYASGTMNYTSEAGDTFTFYANTKTTPKVNGTTVNLNPAKTYDSPYLSMVHGEESATFSYAGYPDLVLEFGAEPSLLSVVPADNAVNVPVSANLVATFDEPVVAGTGFITIKRTGDDSELESFDVATSSRLTFDGPALTINPTDALDGGVGYYVLIDSTAVEDAGGSPFAGIKDNTAWSFTTDGTPPVMVSLSPPDDSSGMAVGVNMAVTFNEPVVAGTGFITLRKTGDNSTVESFDVTSSPRLSFAGSTLTIDPTADLDPATSYYVTIDSTAVGDLSGNGFAGLAGSSAWNFTTSDGTSSPISAVNDGSFGGSTPGATVTQSITVGDGADMLVVMTSAELGTLTGNPMTVTYGGVGMNLAVGNLTNSSIWYLDLATPGITGTNVVVDLSGFGVRNGFAAGWVSISGNLAADKVIALHNTGTSASQSNTVDLTTTVQTFDVVNFNGNNTSGTITVNSPNPTVIYTDTNIGSARAAAAYATGVAGGTHTYQWTISGLAPPHADYRRIDAAAFAVVTNSAPTISDIADQSIPVNGSAGPLAFTVGDAETAPGALALTGSSSNPTLVPNGNIVFGGSGADRTVTITPASGEFGSATITVAVSDGIDSASDTFVLTVTGGSPYDTWVNGFDWSGYTNPDLTATGNPDGDSLTNLQDFAFAFDPTASDGGAPLAISGGSITQNGPPQIFEDPGTHQFFLRYTRRADFVAAGLTYTAQFAADSLGSGAFEGVTGGSVVATGTGAGGVAIEAVAIEYPDALPISGKKARFGRVGVAQTP